MYRKIDDCQSVYYAWHLTDRYDIVTITLNGILTQEIFLIIQQHVQKHITECLVCREKEKTQICEHEYAPHPTIQPNAEVVKKKPWHLKEAYLRTTTTLKVKLNTSSANIFDYSARAKTLLLNA